MPRTRLIKYSFFMNEELAEIDPFGRLLFIGLWILADREGKLEDRPRRLKALLFPYETIDVNKLLNQLYKQGFIIRYSSNGLNYIKIKNFEKHQNPHKNELPSDIPEPDSILGANDSCLGTNSSCQGDERTGYILDPVTCNLDTSTCNIDKNNFVIFGSEKSEPKNNFFSKQSKSVLEYLNEITGFNFKPTEATLKLIESRLREYKYSHVLKAVIKEKSEQWRYGDMRGYLRPKTLFNRTNFDNYYGEIKKETMDKIIKYAKENPNET